MKVSFGKGLQLNPRDSRPPRSSRTDPADWLDTRFEPSLCMHGVRGRIGYEFFLISFELIDPRATERRMLRQFYQGLPGFRRLRPLTSRRAKHRRRSTLEPLESRSNTVTVTTTNQVSAIDLSGGFDDAAGTITLNGSAKINDDDLEVTDGGASEAGSAFYTSPGNITQFIPSLVGWVCGLRGVHQRNRGRDFDRRSPQLDVHARCRIAWHTWRRNLGWIAAC
jgi:hypothetical protein